MKPTIRNKLFAGFSGVILLMALIAATSCYAVFTLRRSAQDAVRIGARLNAVSLEIQVHNLEAQRRVRAFLSGGTHKGPGESGGEYLEEARFEVQEIQQLAASAVKIAGAPEVRAPFLKIAEALEAYRHSLDAAESISTAHPGSPAAEAAETEYETAATNLHERAEDGEIAGREASQTAQEEIDRTSRRSVLLVSIFSALGLIAGIALSILQARAITTPVDHLRDVADNVSMGNLEIAVRRYSNDEIGDLADSFSRMVTAVKFFKMEAEEALEISKSNHPAGLPGAL